jgi:hypothetical protein
MMAIMAHPTCDVCLWGFISVLVVYVVHVVDRG